MPKIYEYLGFIFYFYSNEHEPIHVHVAKAERESIFEIILELGQLVKITKRKSTSKPALTAKEEKEVLIFIEKYYIKIVDKWINFFVLRNVVKMTKVNKKIK